MWDTTHFLEKLLAFSKQVSDCRSSDIPVPVPTTDREPVPTHPPCAAAISLYYPFLPFLQFHSTWTVKWPGSPRYFFLTSPANVEYVLRSNFDNFIKGPVFSNNLVKLLGKGEGRVHSTCAYVILVKSSNECLLKCMRTCSTGTSSCGAGIFNSDGPQWQVQRKLAAHMFSRREFQENIMDAFHRHGVELEAILKAAVESGKPLDMQALFFRFTLVSALSSQSTLHANSLTPTTQLPTTSVCTSFSTLQDSIGDIAFGHTVGAMRDPNVPFARAFDLAQTIVERRFISPGWQLTELLNGSRSQLNAAVKVMDDYSLDLIVKRRAAGDYATRRDLLSRFMSIVDEESGVSPYLHDDAFLRDVVMNFMIAGRDTTGQCLAWAVYNLMRNPGVEQRVSAEAQEVLGNKSAASIDYETVNRGLRYTQAVLHETLRLYPSVPKELKQTVRDDTLPDGTFLPAGSFIAYLPWVMGRLESNWEQPEVFNPERFTGDVRHSPYKFIAFNAGYRTCLGQHMALVEASFVLGLIYRKYTLTALPGQQVTYINSLTLPQAVGVTATVHACTSASSAAL